MNARRWPRNSAAVRPNLTSTMALAILIHGAGVATIAVSRTDEVPRTPPEPQPGASFEVDLLEVRPLPPAGPPAALVRTAPRPLAIAHRSHGAGAIVGSVETSPDRAHLEGDPGENPSAQPEPAGPTKERGPSLSLEQLGIAGRGRVGLWKLETPKRRPGVERSMADALHQADRERGMAAGGPIATALRSAVRSTDTPETGNAMFLARVDSKGKVTAIELLSATGRGAAWQRAARAAKTALASKRLRIPKGAGGVHVELAVQSRVQLPSGADPGLEVRALGIPLKRGRGSRSTRVELFTPKISAEEQVIEMPGGSYRMPVPQFGFNIVGVFGDPADIGSPERRVVSARVVSETVL